MDRRKFLTLSSTAVVATAATSIPGTSWACDCSKCKKKCPGKLAMENMPKITPAELRAAMSKAGKGQWTLVDTNSVQERKTYGVIKGAVKLSSVRDFDVEKELPKKAGTTLVFYGVDQDLYEPFIAARRAQFYEYDVRLLTGGIKAWKSS